MKERHNWILYIIVVLQGSAGGVPAGYKPAKVAGE